MSAADKHEAENADHHVYSGLRPPMPWMSPQERYAAALGARQDAMTAEGGMAYRIARHVLLEETYPYELPPFVWVGGRP